MGLQLMTNRSLILVVLLSGVAFAQQLTPSASQHASLMKKREEIVKLSGQIGKLQAEMAFKLSAMDEACKKVVLENHWPASVECDKNSLLFSVPAPSQGPLVKPPNGVDMYEQSQKKEPKQ